MVSNGTRRHPPGFPGGRIQPEAWALLFVSARVRNGLGLGRPDRGPGCRAAADFRYLPGPMLKNFLLHHTPLVTLGRWVTGSLPLSAGDGEKGTLERAISAPCPRPWDEFFCNLVGPGIEGQTARASHVSLPPSSAGTTH